MKSVFASLLILGISAGSFAKAPDSLSATTLKITGRGYFRLIKDGKPVYARSLNFENLDGNLGSGGALLIPHIPSPANLNLISAKPDGTVIENQVVIGSLQIAMFDSPLAATGSQFFVSQDAPVLDAPGTNGAGTISEESKSITLQEEPPAHETSSRIQASSPPTSNHIGQATNLQPAKSVTSVVAFSEPASTNAKGIIIILHPDSKVNEQSFTLGEIADITAPNDVKSKLSSLWIGNSPLLGYQRKLDENLIELRLKGSGYDPDKLTLVVPSNSVVERLSQTVSVQDLQTAAMQAVQLVAGKATPFTVTTPITDFVAPVGTLTIAAQDVQPSAHGYFVTLEISLNSQLIGTRSMTLQPSPGAISVKPGDLVTVELKAGSAVVTVPGKVMNHAFLGQSVQVKITDVGSSPTIQEGILTAGDRVEVKL